MLFEAHVKAHDCSIRDRLGVGGQSKVTWAREIAKNNLRGGAIDEFPPVARDRDHRR